MKTTIACALYVSAAAALLAACSGNGVGLTAPTALKQGVLLSRSASYLYMLSSDCGGNSRGCVAEFAVGQYKEPIRTIEHGIHSPTALAFDSSANLYVANFDSRSVTVYAPGKITPTRSISGPGFPVALTFDKSGNLFVANERSASTQPYVAVYAPGSDKPKLTITGIQFPHTLLTDSGGNLYVAGSKIWIYAPGSKTPLHVITRGIDVPVSMAFDQAGDLTVANSASGKYPRKTGSVTMYAPKTFSLLRTIKQGLIDPVSLAFSKVRESFCRQHVSCALLSEL